MQPELATNCGIGFDYTPIGNFLSGLNIQATYYIIKLTGVLTAFPAMAQLFNDPRIGDFVYRVPTDWATSGLPGAAGCTSNLLPTTCAPFQEALAELLANPRSNVDPQARTLIYWIQEADVSLRCLIGQILTLNYHWPEGRPYG